MFSGLRVVLREVVTVELQFIGNRGELQPLVELRRKRPIPRSINIVKQAELH